MNAAEREARARVEMVFAAVDRLAPEDLTSTLVPPRDLEERTVLLADLERVADQRGRGSLLDEARATLREGLAARAATRFRDETGVVGRVTIGRPEDLAQLALALEDAAAVAATEDLLDPRDAAVLADPGRRVLGLDPLPAASLETVPAAHGWAPSAADWQASQAGGSAGVDHDEPMAGSRALQGRFFEFVGAAGAMLSLGFGLVTGQPVLGVLGGLVIAGVAWLFGRYRRPINRP
jgi:hypothetical protein